MNFKPIQTKKKQKKLFKYFKKKNNKIMIQLFQQYNIQNSIINISIGLSIYKMGIFSQINNQINNDFYIFHHKNHTFILL